MRTIRSIAALLVLATASSYTAASSVFEQVQSTITLTNQKLQAGHSSFHPTRFGDFEAALQKAKERISFENGISPSLTTGGDRPGRMEDTVTCEDVMELYGEDEFECSESTLAPIGDVFLVRPWFYCVTCGNVPGVDGEVCGTNSTAEIVQGTDLDNLFLATPTHEG